MTPVLYYDKTCPLCTNYQRFLERRLGDRMEYLPSPPDAKDIKYKAVNGQTYTGTAAIDMLTSDFPEVRDLSALLPQFLQKVGLKIPGKIPVAGLKATYKVSGVVRKGYQTVRKGCNCGGKRK